MSQAKNNPKEKGKENEKEKVDDKQKIPADDLILSSLLNQIFVAIEIMIKQGILNKEHFLLNPSWLQKGLLSIIFL